MSSATEAERAAWRQRCADTPTKQQQLGMYCCQEHINSAQKCVPGFQMFAAILEGHGLEYADVPRWVPSHENRVG